MIVGRGCTGYALVSLMLLAWEIRAALSNVEVQIEKSKEMLRHQQKHRPPFLERKLMDATKQQQQQQQQQQPPRNDPSESPERVRAYDQHQLQTDPRGEVEAEPSADAKPTGLQQQMIRHGRSRNHFSRLLAKAEDASVSESSEATTTPPKTKRAQQTRPAKGNGSEETGVSTMANITTDADLEWVVDEAWNATIGRDLATVRRLGKTPKEVIHGVKLDAPTNARDRGTIRKTPPSRQRLGAGSMSELRRFMTREGVEAGLREADGNSSNREYGAVVHHQLAVTHEERASLQSLDESLGRAVVEDYPAYEDDAEPKNSSLDGMSAADEVVLVTRRPEKQSVQVDIVTRFLRIIENQHLLGENCTAGTDLNLGEGVVDRYAQERFRLEANLAVNRANMLTRLWKYAPEVMLSSEYLLHASILSMVEFDEDIFAAGNCYDKLQYKDRWLFCPFAHRLQDQEGVLVKDLAVEYKYLSNSSEWFFIARKNAERVIANNNQYSYGLHSYTHNGSAHTDRVEDEILTVKYEDGRWSKPYYDCGGGNIWMLTYTVPFFGYANDTYFFKGTSGIDIDLRRVDIDQCPLPPESTQLNIFAASDKCKKRTTKCVAIPGLGFRRGSYRCVCKRGFYYPDTKSTSRYYNGTVIEEEFEKLMLGEDSQYATDGVFECRPCAEGCESCEDGSPCVVSLNWLMRTAILILECCIIACLPVVILFTWKYGNVKVVRAASPVLLRVIALGAFFIYCTTIVMYPRPNVVTCTVRVWLREIGFSLTYGALMLKTWRISVIFRVRSAKAVKITDMNLLKRLGIIVAILSVFLGIRTLVAPPVVIVARTADDLKAYLCRTDWWDHSFTTLEVMFLIWGIRLCIVVRKAPSEFNESRFISMAIYNEFLLSVFLNVSMLFLQSPANPDLLYIIFFCHTQLTVTLLLCLIFGSKAYMVFRGGIKEDSIGKLPGAKGKFLGKSCRAQGTSNQTNSISLQQGNFTEESDGVTDEFRRLYSQLELMKEKNMRLGNRHLVAKISAMQDAANRAETQVSTIQAISSSLRLSSSPTLADHADAQRSTDATETELQPVEPEEVARDVATEKNSVATKRPKRKGSSLIDRTKNGTAPAERTVESDEVMQVMESTTLENVSGTRTDVAVVTATSYVRAAMDVTEIAGEARNKSDALKEKSKSKSGHARTHAIVINLDDKSRFSEEVTV